MRRGYAVLSIAVAFVSAGASAESVAGWRQFTFGMTKDQVMAILDGRGVAYGGAVRSIVEIGGAAFDVVFKFNSGQLHEIFLKSGLERSSSQSDQQCLASHVALTHDIEETYQVKGETTVLPIGANVRYVFIRTRFTAAEGVKISAETKFVPALDGRGLCESTLLYQKAEASR